MRELRRRRRHRATTRVLVLISLGVTLPGCINRKSGTATPITYPGSTGVRFGCGTPVVEGSAIGIDVKLAVTDKQSTSLPRWHATATITNHSDLGYRAEPIAALGIAHSKVSTGLIPNAGSQGQPTTLLSPHATITLPIALGAATCAPTKYGNLLPTPATVNLAAVVTLWNMDEKIGRNVRSEPVHVVIH